MFGIALGIRPGDFRLVAKSPRAVSTGVISQFLMLPAITALLVYLIQPHPAIALGMILVAACPGGNVSNFIASISGANIALSVTLTGVATVLCPIFTPINFHFWSGLFPEAESLLQTFSIDFKDIMQTVLLVLVLPLAAGMATRHFLAGLSRRIEKPIKWLSFIILIAFIGVALVNNFQTFKAYLHLVFILVAVHNATAFAMGYFLARWRGLAESDRRSISIETGIQNSGLGLIIIFTFFGGNGPMALVAAWWGVWHIAAGILLSRYLKWKDSGMKASAAG